MQNGEQSREQSAGELNTLRAQGVELGRFKTMVDIATHGWAISDLRGNLVYANDSFARMHGYEVQELAGKSVSVFHTAEQMKLVEEVNRRLAETGEGIRGEEVWHVRRDGTEFATLMSTWALKGADGRPEFLCATALDISAHKRTEEALARERNLLRTLIDSLPDRIYVKDRQSGFVMCNKAVAKDAKAAGPDELTGKTDFDLYPRERAQVYYNEEQRIMKTGEPMVNVERPGVSTTGDPRWALNTKVPWRDAEGNIIGIVGANRDVTEHRQAEQALRESEQRYRTVVDNIGIGVALISPNMEILSLNNQMRKWFPSVDISGQAICYREFNQPPRDGVCSYCPTCKTLQDGQVHEAVTETPAGGEVRNYRIVSSPVTDEKGKVVAAIEMVDDITERKRAEESLRQSEEKYRQLVEQLPAITYTAALDEASTTLYVSPQVEQILGISQLEYKTDPDMWRKQLHSEDRERVMSELIQAHRTGASFVSEYRMTARDGHTVWLRDEARILRDGDGRPLYLQGVMYDVTERKRAEETLQRARDELEVRVKERTADLERVVGDLQSEVLDRRRAEEALRRAEERFRKIFENSVVGMYRTTPDGRVLLANPAIVKMLGYESFEDLAKVNLEEKGIDASTPRSVFKDLMEKEGQVIGLESVWIRRDGTKLFICESGVAVRDERGNVLYYEGTVEDVTERKKAEGKLLAYQKQLRSLAAELSLAEERLRRRIATDIHDNISQNLAISKMKLDSLAESTKGGAMSRAIEEVRELLAQAIESTRSLTFEMSPPVLYELGFEAAVGWLVRQTRQRYGLEMEFTDDGRAKPLDDDVRVLLFQAVRELTVNVVKHAKAHKATVSTRRVRGNIRVAVEDDGVGFAASESWDYRKGGFGLFSIRERLDQVGGRVAIRSRPGRGTCVTLIAPLDSKAKGGKGRIK